MLTLASYSFGDALLTVLEIALFAVALSRAWALVQGKHLRPSSRPETSRPAPPDTSLAAAVPSTDTLEHRPTSRK